MSGFLTAASPIIGTVSKLFGGSGNVQLGSFVFEGIEVPDSIKWGGHQKIIKNVLPGGAVRMQTMGVEFPPIAWSGHFEGVSALNRSRQLYNALHAGKPLPLSWNDRSYTVMICEYEAEDIQSNWIPYRISCDVLRDETIPTGTATPSLLAAITGDIFNAIGVTPDDLAAVSGALSKVQTALPLVGQLVGGSPALSAVTSALGTAQSVTSGALTLANNAMGTFAASALGTGDGVLPAGSSRTGALLLKSASSISTQLGALPIVGGFLGRSINAAGIASP